MKTAGIFIAAAAVALMAGHAMAMDVNQVKAKATPEEGSAQWAEVCAASMMGAAYVSDKDSDDQKLYVTLGKAWIQLAITANGKTYDDYIDNQLTGDMQALYDSGDDVVMFYHQYCLQQSKKLLDS